MNTYNPSKTVNAFEAFSSDLYESLDLAGLAVFAIQRLQELAIPVTFENLVVALFRLFPTKFCLEGYEQYPDAARVGRTLLQLSPKYRNWARGSVQKGFSLTQSGSLKVERVSKTLSSGQMAESAINRQQRPRTMDLNKELVSLEQSPLLQAWKDKNLHQTNAEQPESQAVIDMLGAYVYAPPKALRGRLQRLQQIAMQAGREDLVSFLDDVRREFASLFKE